MVQSRNSYSFNTFIIQFDGISDYIPMILSPNKVRGFIISQWSPNSIYFLIIVFIERLLNDLNLSPNRSTFIHWKFSEYISLNILMKKILFFGEQYFDTQSVASFSRTSGPLMIWENDNQTDSVINSSEKGTADKDNSAVSSHRKTQNFNIRHIIELRQNGKLIRDRKNVKKNIMAWSLNVNNTTRAGHFQNIFLKLIRH